MSHSVLEGIRAVTIGSGPALAQASTVLADFGAEVVAIEPPGGDRFGSLGAGPFWRRGKQLLELDLDRDDERAAAHALMAAADVVVAAGTIARLRSWNVDAGALRADHPSLVHCTITGFGTAGPDATLPGYEGLVAARAGRMAAFEVQLGEDRPIYAAVPVATHLAAQGAVHGIVAALLQRERTGLGDAVETSLLQGLMPFDLVDQLSFQLAERAGAEYTSLRHLMPMPTLNYHPVRTADDVWIQCGNLLEHLFMSFLDATDLLGELLIDERFQGGAATWSPEATEHARDLILTRVQERTAAEWMAAFDANGNVAAEPIVTTDQAIEHRDIAPALVEVDDPRHGHTTQIGPIADLEATPGSATGAQRLGSAPDWSEGNRPTGANPTTSEQDGENRPGRPLEGITILDLSTIIAGPLGMSMLADLGARVIKIEPFGGDPFRQMLVEGRMAVKTNNGKESICVDLKTEAGQAIVHRLAAGADVLVHNFRGPVPAKLGIDPETLHAVNPDLVWAAVSGYHPASESALRPATHPVMGASTGGVAHQAGDALTRDCPTLADLRETSRQIMAANEANPDPNTSVAAASAILLALFARARHDDVGGQIVRINMQTANAWANGDDFLRYDGKPPRPAVDPGHHGLGATYRLYPAAEGWVFLATPTDREFTALCESAGWTHLLEDDRFVGEAVRADHDEELVAALTDCFATRCATDWDEQFTSAGIGCVRADGMDVGRYWATDEQVLANGWAPEIEHPRFGRVRRWGALTTVGGLNPSYGTAPLAGQHTDAILTEIGYSPDDIDRFRSDRIVANEPVEPL